MSKNYCSTLIEPVISLAIDAAQQILKVYNTDFSVQQKEDHTPLTQADMAAHNTIVAGLSQLTPELPILSEESANISAYEKRQTWERYWLVDPLDGTREFIKRNGEFTVNIALIEHNYPILGVIQVPVSGVCYYAYQNEGAFKIQADQQRQPISVRPCPTGKKRIAGSRSHRDSSLDNFLTNIGEHEIISMGSSLKSCLVAEGTADIYPRLGPTSEWDTAAAQCIVEEAGGKLTDTELNRLKYNTKDSLLNPHFLVLGDPTVNWLKYF